MDLLLRARSVSQTASLTSAAHVTTVCLPYVPSKIPAQVHCGVRQACPHHNDPFVFHDTARSGAAAQRRSACRSGRRGRCQMPTDCSSLVQTLWDLSHWQPLCSSFLDYLNARSHSASNATWPLTYASTPYNARIDSPRSTHAWLATCAISTLTTLFLQWMMTDLSAAS